ncbi:MAG: phosphatase PAP2 family protein [Steroidobacteraceae bacterium]
MLKRVFVRERPFITCYRFPSGHTLHAVCFTLQATVHFPQLGRVLIPLVLTIPGSRVVPGLHYPTDVLAEAALGASPGVLGLSLG